MDNLTIIDTFVIRKSLTSLNLKYMTHKYSHILHIVCSASIITLAFIFLFAGNSCIKH